MKNVRLFAVAAALGMFASTVAAAESKTTVKWSTVDSVIKVDVGDKIVAITPTATVTSQEEKVEIGSIHAVNYKLNEDQNWIYNDAFNWTNPDDAMKMLGLNGYRFLAPGSEAVRDELFVDQFSGATYTSIEDMFNALVKKNYVTVEYYANGDVKYMDIPYIFAVPNVDTYKLRTLKSIRLTASSRRAADHMMEDVVDFVVNGKDLDPASGYYTADVITVDTGNASSWYDSITIYENDKTSSAYSLTTTDLNNIWSSYGLVVAVDSKKGEYYWNTTSNIYAKSQAVKGEGKWVYAATGSDIGITSLTAGKTYVVGAGGTSPFTSADVRFLGAASHATAANTFALASATVTNPSSAFKTSRNFGVISSEYQTVDLGTYSGTFDAVAYVTVDELGYSTRHIAKVSDGNVYYQLQAGETYGTLKAGDMVLLNKVNEDAYFNAAHLANLYVDGINVCSFIGDSAAVYPQVTQSTYAYMQGVAGLVEIDDEYDYIRKGKGYKSAAKANATNYTFGKDVYDATSDKARLAVQSVNPNYNQLTKLGKKGYITFVDISDADISTEVQGQVQMYQGASLITRIEIPSDEDYVLENNYNITLGEEITLTPTAHVLSSVTYNKAIHDPIPAGSLGIYEIIGLPANNTDKYVIVYDKMENGEWETHTGLDISKVWSYSEAKEVGTLETLDGKEIECAAVQLERRGDFYPAFDSLEDLYEAVKAVTGLNKALVGTSTDKVYNTATEKAATTFKTWFDANTSNKGTTINIARFNDVNAGYLYANLPQKATVEETKVVDSTSTDVTVTSNLADIDTNKAGVYDLTYTANYNGENVGTTTVTVVVAPKYVRTWGANGKVKTLTSYYVTNPDAKYAHYEYDWDAKKVTVTYYNVDGSIATTSVNPL